VTEQGYKVSHSDAGNAVPPATSGWGRWREKRWGIPAAALALGLSVGGAVGVGVAIASNEPTQSEEYQSLQQELETAEGEIGDAEAAAKEASDRARVAANELATRSGELDKRQADMEATEAAVVVREQAVTALERQIAANSIGNGIWTVGVDVEPGTYRVSESLTGYCYWAILKSGTNGSDIIDNDGPTGGFPTVQLREGQDFENGGCGTFVKQ
jgi:hypothetical protein